MQIRGDGCLISTEKEKKSFQINGNVRIYAREKWKQTCSQIKVRDKRRTFKKQLKWRNTGHNSCKMDFISIEKDWKNIIPSKNTTELKFSRFVFLSSPYILQYFVKKLPKEWYWDTIEISDLFTRTYEIYAWKIFLSIPLFFLVSCYLYLWRRAICPIQLNNK